VQIINDKNKVLSLKSVFTIQNTTGLEVSNSSNKDVWVLLKPEYPKGEGIPSVIMPAYAYSIGEYVRKIPSNSKITVQSFEVEGYDTSEAIGTISSAPENLKIRVLNPKEVKHIL
jgi:hypothetical protein